MNKFVSTLLKRSTLMITSFVLAVSSLSAAMPLFLSQTAHAVGGNVNLANMNGWSINTKTSNGAVESGGLIKFIADGGVGVAQFLTTSDNNSRTRLYHPENINLSDVSDISYIAKQVSAVGPSSHVAFHLHIDADGNAATTNDTFQLTYEPYWQDSLHAGDPAPIVANTWQLWNVKDGIFWASIPSGNVISGLTNGAGGPPFYTLSDVLSYHSNALVTGIDIGTGTYNPSVNALVDKLTFNGDTYDFKASPSLNAENFNTVNDSSYKGISVGFNAKDFGTVSSVTVDMTRADGSHVVKVGAQGVKDLLSSKTTTTQATAPFVITEGSYHQAADTDGTNLYWIPGPIANWTTLTVPTSVKITVTDEEGSVYVINSNFDQGNPSWPTYASLLPDASNSHELSVTGNVYRDKSLNDCYGLTSCYNQAEKLSGWDINLYRVNPETSNWDYVQSVSTDTLGNFNLGLQKDAGTYQVCEVLKSGWTQQTQNWSGTPYNITTTNLSSNATSEGPFCRTINYYDTADTGNASYFGNVDTQKPTGVATYTGGINIGNVIYLKSINDLKYSATLNDNYALKQTSFVVFKLDSNGHRVSQMFCGNWTNSSSSENVSGTTSSVSNIPVNKCSWFHGLGSWTDGTYEIGHIVYDIAGNTGHFNTPTQRFVIDSTPLSVPVNLTPTDNSFINYNSFWFKWDGIGDATSYEVQFSQSNSIDPATGSLNVGVWTGDASHNQPTDPQAWSSGATGVWYWQVRSVDAIGNKSAWTLPHKLTIDLVNPTAAISATPNPAGGVSNLVTITGDASDTNVASYQLTIDSYDSGVVAHTTSGAIAPYDWDTTGLVSGIYTATLVVTDLAGNTTTTTTDITVDNDGPAAAITTSGTQNTATPTIEGTVDADATVLELRIDGVLQTLTWAHGQTSWSFTTSALTAGDHTLQILARDDLGNEGGQNGTITISVPVTLLTAAPGGTTPTPQATVTPGEVLGDQTTNEDIAKTGDNKTNQSPSILGDATTNNPMNLFGLAWYWWLAILAAIIAIWWIIAAALRRRDQGNA